MRRSTIVPLVLAAVALGAAARTSADAMPEGFRALRYAMSISNLAEWHEDYALVVYPTTNSGFGYVLEPNVGVARLMTRARGGMLQRSRLHAMRRDDFEVHARSAERHPHGDHGERVLVVRRPPGPPGSIASDTDVAPPALVPEPTTLVGIERTYRIRDITRERFDLELTSEIAVHEGGRREERAARRAP